MKEKHEEVIRIADEAGKILLSYWKKDLEINFKRDEFDPVTEADKASNAYIEKAFKELYPDDVLVTEESSESHLGKGTRVWYVDPLDGTRYFIAGDDGFSVCIGLVISGEPSFGVVHLPARGITYYGERGSGAYKRVGGVDTPLVPSGRIQLEGARAFKRKIAERRPFDDVIESLPVTFIPDACFAVYMCRMADGEADCAISSSVRASKWDTAASQAILEEVGGVFSHLDGEPLNYLQEGTTWTHRLGIAAVTPALHQEIVMFVKKALPAG